MNIAATPDDDAGDDRGDVRRAELRMDAREDRRQQAVARHGEEDARLAELEDEQHRGVRDDRAEGDDADHPARHGHVLHRQRQRLGLFAGQSAVDQVAVRDHAGEDRGDDDVDDRADDQRADDADRQVALRIARLLGGRRDGVEADVGEEHDRGAGERSRASRSARTGASWPASRNLKLTMTKKPRTISLMRHHPEVEARATRGCPTPARS